MHTDVGGTQSSAGIKSVNSASDESVVIQGACQLFRNEPKQPARIGIAVLHTCVEAINGAKSCHYLPHSLAIILALSTSHDEHCPPIAGFETGGETS